MSASALRIRRLVDYDPDPPAPPPPRIALSVVTEPRVEATEPTAAPETFELTDDFGGPALDAEEEDDGFADPVRTDRGDLEDPRRRAPILVRALLEALAGERPVRQLMRWASAEVCEEVESLVAPRSQRPWAATLRRVRTCEPEPGIAEVSAVIVRGTRTRALALRLEGLDGRWRITALQLG